MNSNDRLMKKIRSLFALAANEGATGNEAENAMRMANKLLEKHAISMMDLKEDDVVGISFITERNIPWVRKVIFYVSKLYTCQYVLMNSEMHTITGTLSNRTTAKIVAKQLIDQIDKETKGKGAAFRNGAVESLYYTCMKILKEKTNCTEEIMPGTGLMPLDLYKRQLIDIDDFVSAEIGKLGTVKSNTRSSQAGREYGKGLNPGARVTGAGQARLS